jgi:hypothetical protein
MTATGVSPSGAILDTVQWIVWLCGCHPSSPRRVIFHRHDVDSRFYSQKVYIMLHSETSFFFFFLFFCFVFLSTRYSDMTELTMYAYYTHTHSPFAANFRFSPLSSNTELRRKSSTPFSPKKASRISSRKKKELVSVAISPVPNEQRR